MTAIYYILMFAAALLLQVPVKRVAVTPSGINFGQVAVGKSASGVITIRGIGNTDVELQRVALEGAALGGEDYQVVVSKLPLVIPVGQSVSLKVTFAPTQAKTEIDNVVIVTDASNSPVTASLAGDGIKGGK